MLDRGFAPDVERIIARATPDRQTALFSATVPDWVRRTADQAPRSAGRRRGRSQPGRRGADRARRLRRRRRRQAGRPQRPARPPRRRVDHRLRPDQARRQEAGPAARNRRLPGRRAPGQPVAERPRSRHGGLPLRRRADPAGDQRRRPRSRRDPRRPGHQRRAARIGRPADPPGRPHRPDGPRRSGDHAARPRRRTKWRQLERGLGRRIPLVPWPGAKAALADPLPTEIPAAAAKPPATLPPSTPPRRDRPSRPATQNDRGRRPLRVVTDLQARPDGDSESTGDPRDLMATHGRDPHRPHWARGDGAGRFAGSGSASPERRAHAIVCASCGQPATVPFRPNPSRPVYCGGCFRDRGRAERA